MHTEFHTYFASLRLLQQLRWAFAGSVLFVAVRLYGIGAKLMPERHPAKPYITARAEVQRERVIPAVTVGLSPRTKRLGQVAMLAAMASIVVFMLIGVARTSYHYMHRHDRNVPRLFDFN